MGSINHSHFGPSIHRILNSPKVVSFEWGAEGAYIVEHVDHRDREEHAGTEGVEVGENPLIAAAGLDVDREQPEHHA